MRDDILDYSRKLESDFELDLLTDFFTTRVTLTYDELIASTDFYKKMREWGVTKFYRLQVRIYIF